MEAHTEPTTALQSYKSGSAKGQNSQVLLKVGLRALLKGTLNVLKQNDMNIKKPGGCRSSHGWQHVFFLSLLTLSHPLLPIMFAVDMWPFSLFSLMVLFNVFYPLMFIV